MLCRATRESELQREARALYVGTLLMRLGDEESAREGIEARRY
jgi:hypothetical protein